MSNADELWCVHVQGPDTVIAMPDKATAELRAGEWNAVVAASLARRAATPHDPVIHCEATRWPWSIDGHAKDLAKHGGNPEDFC